MDELADEGAQHPGGQHVDCGLEGDAEEQVGQVSDAQVEDEDVGGAAPLARLAPSQHRDHQRVAQHPQGEDQEEDDQGDEVLNADAEKGLRPRLQQPGEVQVPAGRLCPSSRLVEGLPGLHPPPFPPFQSFLGLKAEAKPPPGPSPPSPQAPGRAGGEEAEEGGKEEEGAAASSPLRSAPRRSAAGGGGSEGSPGAHPDAPGPAPGGGGASAPRRDGRPSARGRSAGRGGGSGGRGVGFSSSV